MAWKMMGGWCRELELERRIGGFAGVTTRSLGDMDKRRPFEKALRRAGLPSKNWATGRQVHSRRVLPVSRPTAPRRVPAADGFITRSPRVVLCVRAADCVPVFIADPSARVLGLVHAGWRGVQKRILTAAVRRMKRKFGSRPSRLWVALGPHIRSCCYQVGPEVAKFFTARSSVLRRKDRLYLDLAADLRREARCAGVPAGHITVSPHCTGHDRRLFSYRREKTQKRMAAVLAFHEKKQRL